MASRLSKSESYLGCARSLAALLVGAALVIACSPGDIGTPDGPGAIPPPNPATSCQEEASTCGTGDTKASCCDAKLVTGGEFGMGRSNDGPDMCPTEYLCYAAEQPEHTVTVSSYWLDAFEVTVGRFRKFFDEYDGHPPKVGSGAHPRIKSSGWQKDWNNELPWSQEELRKTLNCDDNRQTWSDEPSDDEERPINCVSWYVAFAFCVWDGGRLPTEAEWEYAAAGGSENRLYPWGDETPEPVDPGAVEVPPGQVGGEPEHAGLYGQYDIVGGVNEFVLDSYDIHWYEADEAACQDCANLKPLESRVKRGSDWQGDGGKRRVAARHSDPPTVVIASNGVRCAR